MKTVALLILFFPLFCAAQDAVTTTHEVSVEGALKNPFTISLAQIKTLPRHSIDSVAIYNHSMTYRKTLKKLKTVLLKDLLAKAEFDVPGPRWLSEIYISCVASDNYKVVFSWNEIFNTELGDKISVIVEEDGKTLDQLPDRIALISPADRATGRRYVKGMSKIVIQRIK